MIALPLLPRSLRNSPGQTGPRVPHLGMPGKSHREDSHRGRAAGQERSVVPSREPPLPGDGSRTAGFSLVGWGDRGQGGHQRRRAEHTDRAAARAGEPPPGARCVMLCVMASRVGARPARSVRRRYEQRAAGEEHHTQQCQSPCHDTTETRIFVPSRSVKTTFRNEDDAFSPLTGHTAKPAAR
jgi:hypothetical protein